MSEEGLTLVMVIQLIVRFSRLLTHHMSVVDPTLAIRMSLRLTECDQCCGAAIFCVSCRAYSGGEKSAPGWSEPGPSWFLSGEEGEEGAG